MSIKQNGGVFGRNPTFNDVTIEGQLTFDGDIDINSDLKIDGNLDVIGIATMGGIVSTTLGTSNFVAGVNAGNSIVSGGNSNTCLGDEAGTAINTGDNNVFVGYQTGNSINTGLFNVIVGSQSNSTAVDSQKAQGFGFNLNCAAGYTTIGSGSDDIRAAHGNVTWATVSDERYKKDIADSTAGLAFINALQPRTFKYKTLGELPEAFSSYKADSSEVFKNSDTNHGFIAQEIKAAIDADSSIADGFRLWDDRDDGSQEVAEAALIPILVKAIQELTARIKTLEG